MTNKSIKTPPKGSIAIYKGSKGVTKLEVKLEKETVWLTQNQIAILFNTERSVITKHLNNVYSKKELNKKALCKKCTFLYLINQ